MCARRFYKESKSVDSKYSGERARDKEGEEVDIPGSIALRSSFLCLLFVLFPSLYLWSQDQPVRYPIAITCTFPQGVQMGSILPLPRRGDGQTD